MNLRQCFSAIAVIAIAFPIVALAQQGAPIGSQPGRDRAPMRRALRGLHLSRQQRTQMRQIVTSFRAAHPKGSPRDPQARKAMRAQLLQILTPQQRAEFRSRMHATRTHAAQPPQNAVFPSDSPSIAPA